MLGLPQSGSQSLAPTGRRILALLLDWLVAYGLAALMMSFGLFSQAMLSTAVLVVWLLLGAVSVRLFGFSPGQLALGLMVTPIDNRIHVGLGRALARGAAGAGDPRAVHGLRRPRPAGQADPHRRGAPVVPRRESDLRRRVTRTFAA